MEMIKGSFYDIDRFSLNYSIMNWFIKRIDTKNAIEPSHNWNIGQSNNLIIFMMLHTYNYLIKIEWTPLNVVIFY